MKNIITGSIALILWFAVITQYSLMIDNRIASITETSIRFFSFFTILTNSLCAIYFTVLLLQKPKSLNKLVVSHGTLTALMVYIFVVGLVYQVILRHVWEPQGMQRVVDELLHSINPLLVLFFWLKYEIHTHLKYQQLLSWLIFPLIYLVYILIRGHFSHFYPYPFVDVDIIGLSAVLINSAGMLFGFILVSLLFIWTGKQISRGSK